MKSDILEGCDKFFSSNAPLKVAICTYHFLHDDQKFDKYLEQRNFTTEFSDGYMIFDNPGVSPFDAPYLRKGLIRAKR